jgi:hypothetical protein
MERKSKGAKDLGRPWHISNEKSNVTSRPPKKQEKRLLAMQNIRR